MKFYVVWFQRKGALAYAHTDGEQVMWSSRIKGATKFSGVYATRFMAQFTNRRSLLSTVEV